MATLTSDEQSGFTSAQLTEVAKIAESRLVPSDKYLEENTTANYRAEVLSRWRTFSANELRAKACFGSKSGNTITWASECDLTTDQKTYVEDMVGTVDKTISDLIVEAIGGARSTNQRLTALES